MKFRDKFNEFFVFPKGSWYVCSIEMISVLYNYDR